MKTNIKFGFSQIKDGPINYIGHPFFDGDRRRNRANYFGKQGIAMSDTALTKLVHGGKVAIIEKSNAHLDQPNIEADALITGKKELALTVNMADCPPLMLFDPVNEVIALAHCGWKPLLAGIVENTIEGMAKHMNCDPKNITAYIGPGICTEHYEFNNSVIDKFEFGKIESFEFGGIKFLSLKSEISGRLIKLGIKGSNIKNSEECTYDSKDSGEFKYYSYRRDLSDPLNAQLAWIKMVSE